MCRAKVAERSYWLVLYVTESGISGVSAESWNQASVVKSVAEIGAVCFRLSDRELEEDTGICVEEPVTANDRDSP
jgi:hypothetical protein